jgi:hypothetical protein
VLGSSGLARQTHEPLRLGLADVPAFHDRLHLAAFRRSHDRRNGVEFRVRGPGSPSPPQLPRCQGDQRRIDSPGAPRWQLADRSLDQSSHPHGSEPLGGHLGTTWPLAELKACHDEAAVVIGVEVERHVVVKRQVIDELNGGRDAQEGLTLWRQRNP